MGLDWVGVSQTDSVVAHNKAGVGGGFVGLGLGLIIDRQHCRPQQGRGRQGSGICWTGLGSHRPTGSMPSTRPR